MGNNKSQVKMAIQLDREFYYANETLNGHIYIDAQKPAPCAMILLTIEGLQSCQFRTQDNQQQKNVNKLLLTNFIIATFNDKHNIMGQFAYPFSFKFMHFLPGSYEEKRDYYASIRYTLKASIITNKPKQANIQHAIDVIIREPQIQNQAMLYGQSFANCKSCFCLDKGVSKITCYFQKKHYVPQEQCIIICQIDNYKCSLDLQRVSCQFYKELTLTNFLGKSRKFTELINIMDFEGAKAHHEFVGQNAKRKSLRLIYKNKNGIHPSTNGRYVKCQYFILVKPIFGGCCTHISEQQFKVKIKIMQPAMKYDPLVAPSNWRPSLQRQSNIYLEFEQKNPRINQMTSQNLSVYK